jgi:hypothetical protein
MGDFDNNPSCKIFDGIMCEIYDKIPSYKRNFPQSDGVVASAYCVDSGLLASKACHADMRGGRIETGYFKRGTEPKSHCITHVLVEYDKVTQAIACEKCPKENVINVGMIKVNRSFPCEVRITDSQYTYMYLPAGVEPTLDESLPYFARLCKSGSYFGSSGVSRAKNRYCKEHLLETTTEVTTVPPQTTEEQTTTPQVTAPQTTAATTPKATTSATVPPQTETQETAAQTTVPAETTAQTTE